MSNEQDFCVNGCDTFKYMINRDQVASDLATHKELLFNKLHSSLDKSLRGMTPKESLSFRVVEEATNNVYRKVSFAATEDYVSVLIDFLRGRKRGKYLIDSCVTPIAIQAVERSIADFYSSSEITNELTLSFSRQIESFSCIEDSIRAGVFDNAKWINKEILDLMRTDLGVTITTETAQGLAQSVHVFIASSTGQALMASISKAMAGGVGKVLLTKVAGVVAGVVTSSAFQTAIIAVVKKIGVTVLIKTAIGKAIAASLALLGISASIPIIWIILPLIAGLLVWEYQEFPNKLAAKVPNEVIESLRVKFDELNKQVADKLVDGVYEQLTK